jgi:hypothetical protein
MRPGQNNNKRMRGGGRPPNNRRGPNPLTRSYESNGPDVKIRGNAHHVAEKYLQLARDAHTSGDPVAAENYLQHAEHYYRLIAAAQAAQLAAQGRAPGEPEPDDEDEDEGGVLDRFASPPERTPVYPQNQSFAPQPNGGGGGGYGYSDRQPYEPERPPQGDRGPYQPRGEFQPRGDRNQQNRHDNRPPRNGYNDRRDNGARDNRGGPDGRPQEFRNNFRDGNPQRDPQPTVDIPAAALPSFITAAPRIPTPAESLDAPQPVVDAPLPAMDEPQVQAREAPENPGGVTDDAPSEARFPRGRRRRLRSPYGFNAGGEEAAVATDVPEGGSSE